MLAIYTDPEGFSSIVAIVERADDYPEFGDAYVVTDYDAEFIAYPEELELING